MRHVFLDEAGISDNGVEPFLIVGAAIINPDRHWHDIVNYYNNLALSWVDWYDPVEHGNFVFHAMDVWHGTKAFPREKFSLQERMKIIRQLCQAPDLIGVPLCIGIIKKESVEFLNK